jgi:D-glycero-alpha-D-manno-heptose 1-phosphate guanylyltransferase
MAPVGGKPFLQYQLDFLISQGIQNIIISTGYLFDKIEKYFGSEYCGHSIVYVREEEPLGTGGAVKLSVASIVDATSSVLVLNGDTWFPFHLDKMIFDIATAPVGIALKPLNQNTRYGGVRLSSEGKVIEFGLPAEGSEGLINAGIYLFDVPTIWNIMKNMPSAFSLENDLLPSIAREGLIRGSVQDVPFLDIGIPEDYAKTSTILLNTIGEKI